MKIFYIEDNQMNMRLVKKMLKREHEVIGAATGKEGLRRVHEVQPELILLDINLPDIDGFQVHQSLREDSLLDEIPIVALTANGMHGDKERILAAGFDAYLAKPVTRVEIENTIAHFSKINC